MSDCVRFLTFNDTATPANSSGCNGFAWPTPYSGTTGTGTPNPLQCTLQQSVAIWWKVRNWTLASSCVVTGALGTTNSFTNGVLNPNSANPATEKNLYDHAFPTHEWSNGASGVNTFDITLGTPSDWVNLSPTSVWPFLRMIASGLQDLDGPGFCSIAFDKSALITPKGPMSGSIILVAADISYTLPVDLYYDDSSVIIGGGTFTPGAWSLTATDYWPFASLAAGTPIYSASTGFSLQPPES